MGRIVETLWNCSYCGTKGIRGSLQTCPNCGKTRSKDVKFYLPGQITYVNEPIDKAPDWYCPYCDSYNKNRDTHCRNCGASKENAKNYFEILQEQGKTPDLTDGDDKPRRASYDADKWGSEPSYRRDSYEPLAYNDTRDSATRKPTPRRKNAFLSTIGSIVSSTGGKIIVGILLLAVILSVLFIPRSKTVTIQSAEWTRSIDVEENRIVEEDDWHVPQDAIEITDRRSEIHHYDTVLDHYETVTEQKSREVFDGYDTYYTYQDLGNGYAEEIEHQTPKYRTEYYTETHEEPVYVQVPIYQTKYYYLVWRYVYDHTETASGVSVKEFPSVPAWPELNLSDKQRAGTKHEKYTVTCRGKDRKTVEYTVNDYNVWNQLVPGRSYTVKVSAGHIIGIKEKN